MTQAALEENQQQAKQSQHLRDQEMKAEKTFLRKGLRVSSTDDGVLLSWISAIHAKNTSMIEYSSLTQVI